MDHAGAKCFHVRVQNCHREKLALNCYAYLERVIKRPDAKIEIPGEMIEFKWAAIPWPRVNILASKARRLPSTMVETLTTIDVTDLMFAASIPAMIAVALIALSVSRWQIADH